MRLLSDDAIYVRTTAGQGELVSRHRRLSGLQLRFLGAVTGFTPIRVLMDHGLDEPGMADAITSLLTAGVVRLVENDERSLR